MTFVYGRDNICGYSDEECIAMDSEGTCEVCEGTGEGYRECDACEGHGHVYFTMDSLPIGYDPEDAETVAEIEFNSREHGECGQCDGSGYVCRTCNGRGFCSLCIA